MVQIKWLVSAKSDLNEIYEYISNDSKRYAKLQIQRIISHTQIIKTNLEIGKMVIELNRFEIREIIEGNYRIIYKIINIHEVHILYVHHTSRDIFQRKLLN